MEYDELRSLKELFDSAKDTPKDKSKLDMVLNRAQNILDKYRSKLNSITLSFENLGKRRSYRKQRYNT